MSWVFSEILIPLLVALLIGFLIGWLVFKWRRRTLHAHEWNQLTTSAQQAQADTAAVRAAYEESNNERKILADQAATLRSELEAARSENAAYVAQIDVASQQLAEQQAAVSSEQDRHATVEAELDAAKNALAQNLEQKTTALAEHSAALEKRDAALAENERLTSLLEDAEARFVKLEESVGQDEQTQRELEALNAKIAEQDRTIAQHKLEIKEHAHVLADRDREISELTSGVAAAAGVSSQVADAEARSTELEAALTAARTELDVSQSRIADFDARLATTRADLDAAHARVSELEARAFAHDPSAHSGSEGNAAAVIGQLRVDLAERDRRIAALEAAAVTEATAEAPAPDITDPGDHAADQEPNVDEAEPDPSTTTEPVGAAIDLVDAPKTAVGTAGAHHRDDLKVIHGIGPRMEELLNSLGIVSWEQLADLTESEVASVDDALEEFPGRIERDQWVPQAKDLLKRFPVVGERPTSLTFLNRSRHDDPQR